MERVEAALRGSSGPLLWDTVPLEVLCHDDFEGAKVLGLEWATRMTRQGVPVCPGALHGLSDICLCLRSLCRLGVSI